MAVFIKTMRTGKVPTESSPTENQP
jgi:hypothetical protein